MFKSFARHRPAASICLSSRSPFFLKMAPVDLHVAVHQNPAGATGTVIFICGWPDLPENVFKNQFGLFPTHKIVLMALPYYHQGEMSRPGWSFGEASMRELGDALKRAVDRVNGPTTLPADRAVLIAHDWGAFLAWDLVMRYPGTVSKYIALDVTPFLTRTLKAAILILAYQYTLIFAYLLPTFLGNLVTRFVARVFKAPGAPATIHADMNFVYGRLHYSMIVDKTQRLPPPPKGWVPTVPVLYMYGTRKPFLFHNQTVLKTLENNGGKWAAFDGGHWFFTTSRHVEAVNREIRGFLAPAKL